MLPGHVLSALQEYYLVALSQPRAERLADLQMDAQGKSLAAKMVRPVPFRRHNIIAPHTSSTP